MITVKTGGTTTYINPIHITSVFASDTKVRIHMVGGMTHTINDQNSMGIFLEQFTAWATLEMSREINAPIRSLLLEDDDEGVVSTGGKTEITELLNKTTEDDDAEE